MNVKTMSTDELLMHIGKPGVREEIEARRRRRAEMHADISRRELLAARSRVAGRRASNLEGDEMNRAWMKGCSRRALINVYEQRAAIDNCCGARRKLVPPTGPRKGL